MPEVSAVNVSPTWAVPVMTGAPVAGVLACCLDVADTASVAALVNVSALPASSVKDTRTLMVFSASAKVSV